jgi:hypothetical protein
MNQSGLFHDIDIKRIQNAESGDIQIFYERRMEEIVRVENIGEYGMGQALSELSLLVRGVLLLS